MKCYFVCLWKVLFNLVIFTFRKILKCQIVWLWMLSFLMYTKGHMEPSWHWILQKHGKKAQIIIFIHLKNMVLLTIPILYVVFENLCYLWGVIACVCVCVCLCVCIHPHICVYDAHVDKMISLKQTGVMLLCIIFMRILFSFLLLSSHLIFFLSAPLWLFAQSNSVTSLLCKKMYKKWSHLLVCCSSWFKNICT